MTLTVYLQFSSVSTSMSYKFGDYSQRGPYHIIGWCAAGPLTVELARALRGSGSEVVMLGLIDSAQPGYSAEIRRERHSKNLPERIWASVRYHRNRQVLFADGGVARYAVSVLLGKVLAAWQNFLTHHSERVSILCRFLGVFRP